MSDATSNSSANYVLLTQLADEFAARYRAGQRPSLQEYIDRHPALAADIRDLFPAMVEIEQVKEEHQEAAEQAAAPVAPALLQLGDFRILREVGKGGMGIVYEAEQVSLGRHVALKVMPRNMLLDAKAKRRFEREAKSAARLHHTNIVPVFGVGEQDGMPYYVMQFIQGLGLDDVLEELKKSQLIGPKAGTSIGGDVHASHEAGHTSGMPGEETERKSQIKIAVSAANVARSLLTGEFHSPLDQDVDATVPATVAEAREESREAVAAYSAASSDSLTSSSSSVFLPGQGRDVSKSRHTKRSYWQSVATIGVQVAEAMEYAHKQGIQHRDIKPSNLLLDAQGTVWVTDFGLAKADDQQNLTHTGDILGTLRYMPPEAFEGQTDARSDVYSLGLTLYEMLAFRAAFDEKERNRLIKQVTDADPDRLGKLNRKVPQDLQTIVHKAIDKDPKQRYASAGALAEDLQRFIDDQPIRARQVGAAERYWRWARRNPAIATLGGVLTAVLTVGFVVMSVLWSRAERSATIARSLATKEAAASAEALALATKEAAARKESQALAGKEAKARAEADAKAEQLAREDYVNRVNRAYREVQDDNVALAEDLLHGCELKRRGWEWLFVERLCNSERRVLDLGNTSVNTLAFSPDGTWVVSGSGSLIFGGTSEEATTIGIWDVNSGQRRKTLPGAKGTVFDLAVGPEGKKVAAGFSDGLVTVWDVETGRSLWTRSEPGLNAASVAFSPDGTSLAVGYGLFSGDQVGRVKVWDVVSGKEIKAFKGPGGGVNRLAFHPDGKRLAVTGSEVVEVWDLETVRKLQELKGHKKWVYCLAYSPDGKWLATGGWDRTVKLRDAATGVEALTIFAHEGFVLDLAFSPDGRSLVTTSEDRSIRLWEVPSGRRVSTFRGHSDFVQSVAFRPDGREVGTGSLDGSIRFWDMKTSRPVMVEHTGWVERLAFRRDGLRVLSETGRFGSNWQATKGWNPLTGEIDTALAGIKFDALPKEFGASPGFPQLSAASPDGKLIAQATGSGGSGASRSKEYSVSSVIVRESQTGKIVHTLTGHSADVISLAFSPDGRRLATASYDRTVKLWDMESGQAVFTLLGHTAGVVSVIFSPDGNQILTGGIDFTARVWNATPLGSNMTAEHDARYRKKVETLARLKATTDDAERAKILAAGGQWGIAAEAFASAVEKEPDNLELHHRHIDALTRAGNAGAVGAARVAVIKSLERKLAKEPDDVKAAESLAQVLFAGLGPAEPDWVVLRPADTKTEGGSKLTLQPDGSILVTSAPQTVRWQPGPQPVQALRIETSTRTAPPTSGAPLFSEYQVVSARMADSRPGALRGRFVRLDLPGDNSQFPRVASDGDQKFINLAELQVFHGEQNIALRKKARASSGDGRLEPGGAVDGNTVGNDDGNPYAHTWDPKDPWWEVDLGSEQAIDRIVVWNRSDINAYPRMNHFRVRVLDPTRKVVFEQVIDEAPNPSKEIVRPVFLAGKDASPAGEKQPWILRLPGSSPRDTPARFRVSVATRLPFLGLEETREKGASADVVTRLALAYASSGRQDAALQYFSRALAQPGRLDARKPIIELAVRFDGLVSALVKRLSADPQMQPVLAQLLAEQGILCLAEGRPAQAQVALEKSREILTRLRERLRQPHWTVLRPIEMKSEGGATLTLQGDGSILASGKNPDADTYMLICPAPPERITTFRLETIPDPSLPYGSSGRATENGNFALSEWNVSVRPRDSSQVPRLIRWTDAASDHRVDPDEHYGNLSIYVGLVIDGEPRTYWESWPRSFAPHWAIFLPEEPISPDPGGQLQFVLEFRNLREHNLGRFRLSVTSDRDAFTATQVHSDFERNELTDLDIALATAHAQQGRTDEAVASLTEALSLSSDRAAKARIIAAAASLDGVLEKLAAKAKGDGEFQAELARRLAGRGKKTLATEALAIAVEREPGNLQLRYDLIEALVKAGDTDRLESACDDLRMRFGNAGDPLQALAVTGICRLAPLAIADSRKRAAVHDLAMAKDDNQRLLILARAGQWDLLSETMAKVAGDQPNNPGARIWHLLSFLELGDIPGYRVAAGKILSQSQKATELNTLNNAAWWCTYTPDAVADVTVPVQMAKAAVAGYPAEQKRLALNTLGAALYRAGRIDEAIARLNEGMKAGGGVGVPQDWVYLAMAHYKKGDADEARSWLEKVRVYVKDERTAFSSDLVESRFLLKEAEALLRGDPPRRP